MTARERIALAAAYDGPECQFPVVQSHPWPRVHITDGPNVTVARYAWVLRQGDPGAQHVLHTCGNGDRGCANTGHMYLGNHAQNMVDRDREGKAAKALTPEAVLAIRERPGTIKQMSHDFGVSATTIKHVLARRTWPHI